MMGSLAVLLISLGVAGGMCLVAWAIVEMTDRCIRSFRRAVWTRALHIARERPETLAQVIPQLVRMGVILDIIGLNEQMPRRVRKFIESASAPTQVEVVVTGAVEILPSSRLDLTSSEENDMYFSAAQEAWARVHELEDQLILIEAERDLKDELRARHLRRVRRIEEALDDPAADLFAAVHPFLARAGSTSSDSGRES